MLLAYLNYSSPHVTIHHDEHCSRIRMHGKADQRVVTINLENLSQELAEFRSEGHHRFASERGLNDMWLHVDLGDTEFEEAVVHFIRRSSARKHRPFAAADVSECC